MTDPGHDIEAIQKRVGALQRLLASLILKYRNVVASTRKQELLFRQAELMVGRDASPRDIVGDELGCAESVSAIIRKVIRFPLITGTWSLNHRFQNDERFERTDKSSGRGTLIICATGTGNGKIRGHVGILGDSGRIMSSTSRDGIWRYNYTIKSWIARWQVHGGFRVYYYRLR